MAKKKANAITRLQKFLAAIAGDTTAPEPVTNEEKLLYNIAEKANEPTDDKFIVTFTLTSESGGTMDHTNAEILDAYMAGKTIMFDISLGDISTRVQATLAASFDDVTYPSFNALGVNADHQLIHLYVDPRNSESDTFTMQVEDLGGGSDGDIYDVALINIDNPALDRSYDEIVNAINTGKHVYVRRGGYPTGGFMIIGTQDKLFAEWFSTEGGGTTHTLYVYTVIVTPQNDITLYRNKIVDYTTT